MSSIESRATRERRTRARSIAGAAVFATFAIGAPPAAQSITTAPGDLADVEAIHGGAIEHCDEAVEEGFLEAVECGDELFEVRFNAVDGVGGNVGDGGRFSRGPRADLDGPGQWANHVPERATGPNAESCVACHQGAEVGGAGDGSGPAGVNVMRDPFHTADPGQFIQRNTPHNFGGGALQRLAEEMTEELRARRDGGIAQACESGGSVDVELSTKGVSFGSLRVSCAGIEDDSGVAGVDPDLIVRPFQWKGTEATVRSFVRGAGHNELGMQAVELVGEGVDGDADGVVDELTIPDVTAMAVYLGAQPRPVTQVELNRLRIALMLRRQFDTAEEFGLPTLTRDDLRSISRGERLFAEIGCEDCHRSALRIEDPTFSEPSTVAGYRDDPFPAGQPGLVERISFDLTRDLPDNQIQVGRSHFDLGNFERPHRFRGRRGGSDGAIVRLYGDLKRHDMGPELAENTDETGHGASVWITKELWGVGSSGPYLHDGRATTLTEAVLEHGGEAAASRAQFAALSEGDEADVVRFLENLVLFFPEASE
jgi:hypothetical protein